MDLTIIWKDFMEQISTAKNIEFAEKKTIAGLPFLYITLKNNREQKEVEKQLCSYAMTCMQGKRLNFIIQFVRAEHKLLVFRARFLVPQEKMFCCGNMCEDCIRFKDSET
jgi:hypothetical protein